MANQKQSVRDEYIAKLRATLKPGDTLHTILRSVSRSGMSRVVDVYHMHGNADGGVDKSWLSFWIAKATGMSFQDQSGRPEGIKVGGCGMDVGFEVVYNLGRALYPDGVPCSGESCRSNDHSNGDRNRIPHSEAHPHMHHDGGYAFGQQWL